MTAPPDAPEDSSPHRTLSRRAQIIGGVIALVVVAGLGWLAWDLTHDKSRTTANGAGAFGGPGGGGARGGGPGGRSPAVTVGVATAEKADVPIVVEALGTVTPIATVKVRSQVNGTLQAVLYKEGQMVKKGDILAVIDPRQFELTLQQATGQRMKDEAQLQAARVQLERYRTLLKQDSIARQDVDTQDATVKQLEGSLVVDRANEGTARLNLGYTRIVAPVGGRVGLRTVDIGNYVSTSDANGVAVITQLSPIDVQFAVPQDQAPALQQNANAGMQAQALDRTRSTVIEAGNFVSLDNQIDPQTGTVKAKARFDNAKGALFPSQFVNLRLNVQTIKGATVVPVAALRHGNSGDYVFVLNQQERTVSMRPVKAGQASVDKVQIASGLQAGEKVITEGADRLRDGSRVILPGDAPQGGRRRDGASAPASAAMPEGSPAQAPAGSAPRFARRPASAVADTSTAGAAPAAVPQPTSGPTPEQRQRMLDAVKDDPEQLERRKRFLDAIDKGDPQALERWRAMVQRRQQGSGSQ